MSSITKNFGSGGAPMSPTGNGGVSLAQALRDIADDLATLKASVNGITAKLDADAGVTDTNYTALWAVGTLLTLKV